VANTLTGKVALVTGGSRGIGAAIARALADEGADVAISYLNSVEKAEANIRDLERRGSVRAVAFKADQADPAQVATLVKAVVERFGRLDILVNSAGVLVTGSVDDPAGDIAAVQRQFAINIGGAAAAGAIGVCWPTDFTQQRKSNGRSSSAHGQLPERWPPTHPLFGST
jgi:3-oxoacyl-[acyl-carrier protein] reductase